MSRHFYTSVIQIYLLVLMTSSWSSSSSSTHESVMTLVSSNSDSSLMTSPVSSSFRDNSAMTECNSTIRSSYFWHWLDQYSDIWSSGGFVSVSSSFWPRSSRPVLNWTEVIMSLWNVVVKRHVFKRRCEMPIRNVTLKRRFETSFWNVDLKYHFETS